MKVVIADTGAIISLIHIKQLDLVEQIFGEYYITKAVWIELNNYEHPKFDTSELIKIKSKVKEIHSTNYLSMIMDYGEAESSILYQELQADYLLIDDNKARKIAESLGINCIGTLGLLLKAKDKNLVGRYFAKTLLNNVLEQIGEQKLI